ncbi:MAG: alpha/beta hydrolase [Hyphomicrobiales bacterium]|nr:alpha/beta hydrolase [Hyphomicrobiales bacterium]
MRLQPTHEFVSAPDGLKLHYAQWGDRLAPGAPVVCLPGLARTTEDFGPLAEALANGGTPRRVLALDYRGRGRSEYDRDWKNYDVRIENDDILAVLDAAEVARAIFVGTSRGGLHAMTLAAVRPTLIRATVLNDIGAVVEPLGLLRIKGYVGKLPAPRTWDEAVTIAKSVMSAHFTGLSDADWRAYAHMTFAEKDGRLAARYDPKLARTLEAIGPDMPRIELWPQFEALAQRPVLVVRGEHSDILSNETFEAMQRRSAACEGYVAPGQGHAPLLIDPQSIGRILEFVEKAN